MPPRGLLGAVVPGRREGRRGPTCFFPGRSREVSRAEVAAGERGGPLLPPLRACVSELARCSRPFHRPLDLSFSFALFLSHAAWLAGLAGLP